MARYRKQKNDLKINIKRLIGVLLFLIIVFFLVIIVKKSFFDNTSKETFQDNIISEQSEKKEDPITFTMTALGDSLCHNTQYWDAYNNQTKEYDFSYVYEDIIDYTKNSDITIGSLETTFAGEERGYSNYPTFNTPDSLATALKNRLRIYWPLQDNRCFR